MIYYFIALLAAALILLFSNVRNETNRWAAFFLMSASVGGVADTFYQTGLPRLGDTAQLLNHTLTPYGVLVFCIVYSGKVSRKAARLRLKGTLVLPVLLMLAITPLVPVLELDFGLLLLWTAPYYLASCYLLLASLWSEENRWRKRNRLITTIIIVPTLLAVLVFINIAKVISPDFDFFGYISVFMIYSFVVAILGVFLYGVLGVRLRFEREPLDSTMKAVSSGTTLLNHTIKNELGKIAISTVNLKHSIGEADEQTQAHLAMIEKASGHMLAMVNRIHSQTKDIVVEPHPCRLAELTDVCVSDYMRQQGNGAIVIERNFMTHPVVVCDAIHMKEVIGNILANAGEAMPDGGTITIKLESGSKGVSLSFHDTGKGIPADQLTQVFEPFYSTKNRSRNFGLGLSYVYNVMQQSGGSVVVNSREGAGTVVTLNYPRKKIAESSREAENESH
ncbi:HAMP domain-containing sensor histidine kinase [Paenibacillus sp. FJAT-26967]|uniref:sensor histidine kinase n=1 Tax=Paenibacillus sp. FJAT-26967 TaxID=1729690 RepID=UPI0008385692|nr:HAMP domain-containing sensor histidine kinase [Paenibacillus sp. FJAT-26967]